MDCGCLSFYLFILTQCHVVQTELEFSMWLRMLLGLAADKSCIVLNVYPPQSQRMMTELQVNSKRPEMILLQNLHVIQIGFLNPETS